MSKFPEVDLILYMDIGCEFNSTSNAIARFYEYCNLALNTEGQAFELAQFEKDWTSSVTLIRLEEFMPENRQIASTILTIKSNQEGKRFI